MSWFKNPLKYWGLTSALVFLCLALVGSVLADDIEIDLGSTPTVTEKSKTSTKASRSDNGNEESISKNSVSDGSQSSINKIDVSSSPLGDLVSITGTVLSEPSVEKISDKKLLVKFENTALLVRAHLKFNSDFVMSIRSAAHEKAAWVVLDVVKVQNWKVNKTSSGYALLLQADKTSRDLVQATPVVDSQMNESDSSRESGSGLFTRLIETSIKPLDKGIKLVLTSNQPAKYTFRKLSQPDKLILRFHSTKLEVTEKLKRFTGGDVEFIKGGLVSMELRQIGPQFSPISEVILTLVPGTLNEIDRDLNQVVITLAAPAASEKQAEKKADINQLVSMDIQSADLNAVLRTLASESGFDVDFVSGPVAGVVNEKFDNVPLKIALSNLLAPGAYGYEVQGNRLRIGTQALLKSTKLTLPKVTEIIHASSGFTPAQLDTLVRSILDPNNASITAIDTVRNVIILNGTVGDVEQYKRTIDDLKLGSDAMGDRITKVVKLNYSDPAVLMGILTPYLSPVGKVQVEPRMTSLVLWETAANMGVLLELVKELDIKSPQVLIESNIVEIDKLNSLALGMNWNLTQTTGNPNLNGSLVGTIPAVAGSLGFGTVQGGVNINGTLSAMEAKQLGKIISRPRVATASGVPAEINSVENIIYTTVNQTIGLGGVITNTQTFNTLPLPVDLKITPRITDDGRITTVIVASVTSQTGAAAGTGPPPTSQQTANTTITIKNGETIVMGGLVRDTVTDSYTGVPLLMNLPLIGDLFQQKSLQHQKVELVIFITPTIIQD